MTNSTLLKCWGANRYGQLGDGTTAQRATPTTINVGGAVGLLALGYHHTCAYLTNSTLLKCWGDNYYGQLGDGTTAQRATPTTINVGGAVGLLALGYSHTCAYLTSSTILKCWGYNNYGQLGDNTTTNRATPTTIDVGGAVGLLALGYSHTCAYLTSSTILKCWGYNGNGQLGDGTTAQRATPTTIDVGGAVGLLALGYYHTCAYLTSSTLLKCWGSNGNGQLGDGTTTQRATPTTINFWGAVGLLALGYSHTCAYLTNSTPLKCWGSNGNGQLGDNTTTNRVSPFFSPPALCGTLSEDTFLFAGGPTYVLTCQVFVPSGIVLRIAQGVTIYASPVAAGGGGVPALIIEKGGSLLAEGSATAPITFTAFNPTVSSSSSVSTDSTSADTVLETRGKWGGLILLGNAPTNVATSTQIEGITGYTYGGSNPTESSGSLQYVRVWHGGAIVGANNEINGITFGGVGSGTVVDHCEVAFNVDDGFEFFGGTVNVKYLSVLFVGDDGFDTDQGYIGKGQFLFVIEGLSGDHSMEIDSGLGSNQDVTPRSHPAFYSFTLIGGGTGTGARTGELIHVNDGTGGKFGNGILAHPHLNGLLFEDCGSTLSYTQTLPAASVSISNPGYFYFSANNIIDTATTASQFALHTGTTAACTAADTWTAVSGSPGFVAVATTDLAEGSATFNPLPSATGAACTGTKDALPNSDPFFSSVSCKGAFGSSTDNWLAGYSWLACSGKMVGSTCTSSAARAAPPPPSPPPRPPPSPPPAPPPMTSGPAMTCGPGTYSNSITQQCEIACGPSNGRRMDTEVPLDTTVDMQILGDRLRDVTSYLVEHPEVAASIKDEDFASIKDEELRSRLKQLFGQPALA